jgi:hypothetical protein
VVRINSPGGVALTQSCTTPSNGQPRAGGGLLALSLRRAHLRRRGRPDPREPGTLTGSIGVTTQLANVEAR